jgi:hypothetical protein
LQHTDEAIIHLKITVRTWAPLGKIQRHSAALARTTQNWGLSEISEISGDPFEKLMATVPARLYKAIGPKAACDLLAKQIPHGTPRGIIEERAPMHSMAMSHLKRIIIDQIYRKMLE